MTQAEFDMVRAAIKAAWPGHTVMPDSYSIRFWYTMIGHLDYQVAEMAIMQLAATKHFPPQISDILEKASEITEPQILDSGEAWNRAIKAVERYGPYNVEKAMMSMPELVREAVRRIGYMELCNSQNISADRAHFFRIYDQLRARRAEEQRTPPKLRERQAQIRRIEALKHRGDKIPVDTLKKPTAGLPAGPELTENDITEKLDSLKRRLNGSG